MYGAWQYNLNCLVSSLDSVNSFPLSIQHTGMNYPVTKPPNSYRSNLPTQSFANLVGSLSV